MYRILKNIPNALTLIRLAMIGPFVWYLLHDEYTTALYVFFVAGLTDGFDGWLARHFQWQSHFGSFADPLADKLLVASSFISLALLGALPWWLALLVFLRDVIICMGVLTWYFFIQRKIDFEPTVLSKINTTLQLMLVTLCLFQLAYFNFPAYCEIGLIYLTVLTTVITCLQYIWLGFHKASALEKN